MSGTSSTTSSRSSSFSTAEKKSRLIANTTTVSRNIARDNAVQINGAVARKIYNLNFDLYYQDSYAKNVVLYSKISNRRQVVRATFQPSCSINFIARRIVKRLGLKLESNNTTHVVRDQDSAPPNTNWIDIACRSETGANQTIYRFYIVKNSPYDLLFGCGASAQSSDSGH
ncbi:hypothetical protein BKA63DRAFT_426447 [Paraphoma chrysanthemicola]|nr:hypothetical protein BKA63DRAFT_426447 [Paraphoma chrysanthemicola]